MYISYMIEMAQELETIEVLNNREAMLPYFNLVSKLGYPPSKETYSQLLEAMIPNSYQQIVYKIDGKAIGLAGFWTNTKLFSGKYIDVDNVIVSEEARSKGVGKKMMDWIEAYAKSIDAKMIVLDAFAGNKQAHKFYFREGYEIKGYHFTKDL